MIDQKEDPTAEIMAQAAGQAVVEVEPDQNVTLYLWGKNCLVGIMPLSEARKQLGTAGISFRQRPPLTMMFSLGLGAFFAGYLGLYAHFFYGSVAWTLAWVGIGLTIGVSFGVAIGMVIARKQKKQGNIIYHCWSWWDPEANKRVIEPIEHDSFQMEMTPEYREAFLYAIGEKASPPGGSGESKEGQNGHKESEALSKHMTATYSAKKLYVSLEAAVYKRILAGYGGGKKFLQYASIGGIAVSLLIVAALVTLVMSSDSTNTPNSPPRVDNTQEFSDAK